MTCASVRVVALALALCVSGVVADAQAARASSVSPCFRAVLEWSTEPRHPSPPEVFKLIDTEDPRSPGARRARIIPDWSLSERTVWGAGWRVWGFGPGGRGTDTLELVWARDRGSAMSGIRVLVAWNLSDSLRGRAITFGDEVSLPPTTPRTARAMLVRVTCESMRVRRPSFTLLAGDNHQTSAVAVVAEVGRTFAQRFRLDSLLSSPPVSNQIRCDPGYVGSACIDFSLAHRTELAKSFTDASGGRSAGWAVSDDVLVHMEVPYKHATTDTVEVAVFARSSSIGNAGHLMIIYSLLPAAPGRWKVVRERDVLLIAP